MADKNNLYWTLEIWQYADTAQGDDDRNFRWTTGVEERIIDGKLRT